MIMLRVKGITGTMVILVEIKRPKEKKKRVIPEVNYDTVAVEIRI